VRDAPTFELTDSLDALVRVAEDDTVRIQERVVVEALQRLAEPVVPDVLVRVGGVARRFRELAEVTHHRSSGFLSRLRGVLSAVEVRGTDDVACRAVSRRGKRRPVTLDVLLDEREIR
jgi:hypothetical protein